MRYLLVTGFSCDLYRKEPKARIFVGDKLIDEFNISHSPDNLVTTENKFLKHFHILQPFAYSEYINILMKNLPTLKFYELEVDKKIKHLTVRINIANNDSNYSNGFITKSTLIKLKVCCFFPLDITLLLRLQEIRKKNMFTQNYAWYRSVKNIIFNPGQKDMCWQDLNGQTIENKNFETHDIGGDGEFTFKLIKKYGIFIRRLTRSCRHSPHNDIILHLFDKYFHHANQRNNN